MRDVRDLSPRHQSRPCSWQVPMSVALVTKRVRNERVPRQVLSGNGTVLREIRGLGPSTSKSMSRLCARDIRGFLLEMFETLGTAHCCDLAPRGREDKASVVLSPAQRRTVSTHGLNLRYSTVPLSEPTPACDSVRDQNDAGYVGSLNIWNWTPSSAQSSAINIPMVSMSSLKVDGWWGEKKSKEHGVPRLLVAAACWWQQRDNSR